MRVTTVFNRLLNLQGLWVRGFEFEGDDLVLLVAPRARRMTCPRCGKSRSGQLRGNLRRWRHLGIWGKKVWLLAPVRRFRCSPCSRMVTETVPWARHDSDFTRPFEDAVGMMAQSTDKTAVSRLFGISWETVGNIAERLTEELLDPARFASLKRIGVDEISFRKRHRYLTIVCDHDTGNVVWAAEGKSSDVLTSFFRSLDPQALEAIDLVTMDMGKAYQKAVRETLPNATIAFDHFHVTKLANEALQEVRRAAVRDAPSKDEAKCIKDLRWLTCFNFDNLPERYHTQLEMLDPALPLGAAYLLKEQLVDVLHRPRGFRKRLRAWIEAASNSAIQPFERLARTIEEHLPGIFAFKDHQVSNARAEGINNKIRLVSHRAFGFHSAASLIAMIYLCCGGIRLPGKAQLL